MTPDKSLRKIDAMHSLFGKSPGKRCKDCPHLFRRTYDRSYYKCEVYGDSCSFATDWAQSWEACGLIDGDHWRWYQIRQRDGTVVNMLKHESRKAMVQEECKGQIRMEDLLNENQAG